MGTRVYSGDMKTYQFQMRDVDGTRDTLTVTENDLHAIGWFAPDVTIADREVLLWDLVDAGLAT